MHWYLHGYLHIYLHGYLIIHAHQAPELRGVAAPAAAAAEVPELRQLGRAVAQPVEVVVVVQVVGRQLVPALRQTVDIDIDIRY